MPVKVNVNSAVAIAVCIGKRGERGERRNEEHPADADRADQRADAESDRQQPGEVGHRECMRPTNASSARAALGCDPRAAAALGRAHFFQPILLLELA